MTPEMAWRRLVSLSVNLTPNYQKRAPNYPLEIRSVEAECICGYRWSDVPYDDLPRVLADRENGRCSPSHEAAA